MAKGQCSFRGCNKPAHSKGLCGAHYQHQRQGKPLKPLKTQYHGLTEQERFESRVSREKHSCWVWTGPLDKNGYARFRNATGYPELVHRVAWRFYRDVDPGILCVLHRCDNPRCVNPRHLYLGTQADNVADMWARGRANPGVSRGERHGCAKLTEEAVKEIRTSKDTARKLAEKHGVSDTQIYDVRHGKSWRHHKTPPIPCPVRRRLTKEDVLAIRASEERGAVLAKRYGVRSSTISRILTRVRWRNI